MPAEQRGSDHRTTTGYGIRWTDETCTRRRQAGFTSPSKARAWFRDVELPRMRGGGLVNEPLTLREFSGRCGTGAARCVCESFWSGSGHELAEPSSCLVDERPATAGLFSCMRPVGIEPTTSGSGGRYGVPVGASRLPEPAWLRGAVP
jgi:hypothetical protein